MGSTEQLADTNGSIRQLRKRRTAADVQGRYQQLRIEYPNASAGALRRTLLGEFRADEVPTERTFREWLKRDGAPPAVKPWGFGSMDSPERNSVVVGLLRRVQPGQWWPNEDEAWWSSQILLSAPGVPAATAISLARLYWLRTSTGRGTEDLDEFVAFAPWDPARAALYQAAIDAGDVNPPPVQLYAQAKRIATFGAEQPERTSNIAAAIEGAAWYREETDGTQG
ncbi:MAG: hypothetical protein IT295_10295 [Dehalococcoidia bacterium]|nr:hypothetical protein [Dehalococcoidia bacterium]